MGVYHLRNAFLASVLAVCALLTKAQISDQVTSIPYGRVVCQDARMSLYCPRGYYIRVTSAFYGRRDSTTCSDATLNNNVTVNVNVRCNALGVKRTVVTSCDGKTSCGVTADHNVFVASCPVQTVEYLEVSYVCEQIVYKALLCEATGVAPVACPKNSCIQTISASFGRNSATTCPHSTAMNVTSGCSTSTAKNLFYQRCNGRNRCELNAQSSIYGDPCPGTYKYLQVSYSCAECVNLHSVPGNCEKWRMWGECHSNAIWMIPHCRQSCTHCSKFPPECKNIDKDTDCEDWEKKGECKKNPSYMYPMCRKSCLKCDEQGTNCSNAHPNDVACWWWASRGECHKNPDWMFKNCYKSCTKCQIYDREPVCKNEEKDTSCSWWKSRGECYKNPDWMYPNCWKACTSCDYKYAANHLLGNDAVPGPSVSYISPMSFILSHAFKTAAKLQYFVGYFNNLNKVKLQIWRPVDTNRKLYSLVYEQTVEAGGIKQVQVFSVSGCQMVKKGDRLGFTEIDGASPLAYRFDNSPGTPTLFRKTDATGAFDSLFYPFLFSYAAGYDAGQSCTST